MFHVKHFLLRDSFLIIYWLYLPRFWTIIEVLACNLSERGLAMKSKIKTTLCLTGLAVGCLHLINRWTTASAVLRNLLNKDSGKRYEWRFGNIYYTKTGTGSPLLLVHDLSPYSSSYEWNELIEKLSKDHTVYAVDLLGCGRSDKPNITYTNYLYVQMVNDFIKNIIGQRTNIIATGLSSSFVVMACHMEPELFNKIMMINPEDLNKLRGIPGKYSKLTKILMDLPIIGTMIYNIYSSKDNLEYLFTENYLYNPFNLRDRQLHIYHEAAHLGQCCGRYLLSSINGSYLYTNITHALKDINNSIFILCGSKCENIKYIVDNYVEVNPAIETEFIGNAKFLPQVEVPELVYQQVEIFF